MPAREPVKLTKRAVDALSVEFGDTVVWDRDLPGFGIRVYASGRKVWCVQTRGPAGGPKRFALGRYGDVTADEARRDATIAIDRIKQGLDPVPPKPAPEPTVADLAERYMEAHVKVNCRPKTVETFGRIVRLYIVPELGGLKLSEVDRAEVAALHHKLRDKPYQANATMDVIARMFRLAEAWGMTPPRRNPCRSIRRYKETRRDRFLTPEEYREIGRVLDEAEADKSVFPTAVPAIRLLLLTGCRKNEIVTLKWDDVDRTAGELRLTDGKTGWRSVPLTPAVEHVLDSIPRLKGNPWVIAGQNRGDHLKNLDAIWLRLRERADLKDVRLHDCRHSYASRALALGEGLSMIAALLGHRKVTTTARYAHLARDTEKASAAKVGGSIGSDILPRADAA
ncbi:MAG: tyrosine-type recombinase/integrase [Rhodospirillales bacterium]|nr:tyrosine-type recombinase/integrase [Rhodospirillales bacterium]